MHNFPDKPWLQELKFKSELEMLPHIEKWLQCIMCIHGKIMLFVSKIKLLLQISYIYENAFLMYDWNFTRSFCWINCSSHEEQCRLGLRDTFWHSIPCLYCVCVCIRMYLCLCVFTYIQACTHMCMHLFRAVSYCLVLIKYNKILKCKVSN